MIVEKLNYFPYDLILRSPFKSSAGIITKKKVFYIESIFDNGKTYLGEAALFPELGTETEQIFIEAIEKLKSDIKKTPMDLFVKTNELFDFNRVPTLEFALSQCAFNKMTSETKDNFPIDFFCNKIKVNAIIGLSQINECVQQAIKFVNDGYETIKIKLGRENFLDDLQTVEEIRNVVGDSIKLRIDINGKWNLLDSKKYLDKLEKFDLQFAEQPTENLKDLIQLSEQSPIPIALDMAFSDFNFFKKLFNTTSINFFVIKPVFFGNVFKIYNLICLGKHIREKVIISSSIESSVARSMLVFLSAAVDNNFSHGLSTKEYIQKELYKDPYNIKNGVIDFDINNYPPKFIRVK
ncbi:MAG: hypothetical protein JXA68_02440 [Ignavibacteriales bacterium]|nr:hypothetical protein [Ignavibacteriales bacterium]